MLLKMGLDPNEFGSLTKNSNRRIHYYNSPDNPSMSLDPGLGNIVTADTLWNSKPNLALYDAVILACEQAEHTSFKKVNGYANMVNYTDIGGRAFMSHYSYVWLKYNPPWQNIPNSWAPSGSINTQVPLTADVVTASFPKGVALSQWLYNIGASAPNPQGRIDLIDGHQDTTLPLSGAAQPWTTATNTKNALNPPL